MKKRKNLILDQNNSDEANFEIDLAPMLALMVTLIPVMLLSTAFVKIALIETPLPQVIQQAMAADKNKKMRDINVVLSMTEQGYNLEIQIDGKSQKKFRLPKVNNKWDLEGLYGVAHRIKLKHPTVFRIDLKPSKHVKYSDIIKVMDELRKIKRDHQKAIITDKKSLKKVQTDIMFPDINFSNVVEG